jgi:hypothetical protein
MSTELRIHCNQGMRYDVIVDGDVVDGQQLTGTYYCERCSTMQSTYAPVPSVAIVLRLVAALNGLRRSSRFCWCRTWVGGEHEPQCLEAQSAIFASEGKL